MCSKIWVIVFGFFLISTIASAVDEQNMLVGSWSVVEINGSEIVENTMPNLTFTPQGGLSATAGCNRMSGSYEIDDDALMIGRVATTRMMCPEPLMSQEAKLIGVLETARHFMVEEDKLILLDADDTKLLTAISKSEQ